VDVIGSGVSWQAGGQTRMRPAFAHKTSCITLRYYYNFMRARRLCRARRADQIDIFSPPRSIVFSDFKPKHRREPPVSMVPDGICAPGLPRRPQFAWAESPTAPGSRREPRANSAIFNNIDLYFNLLRQSFGDLDEARTAEL
jgi:hypothetical protein